MGALKLYGTDGGPLDSLEGKVIEVDMNLHNQAMQIININCAGCHQNDLNGNITDILNVRRLVETKLVTVGKPNEGRMIGAIVDGTMPKGTAARVTAEDLQILRDWISSMKIVDDVGQPPLPTRPLLGPNFTAIYANIIQPKCIGCHGPNKMEGGKRFDSYALVFASRNEIYSQVQSGGMPYPPYPAVSSVEFDAIEVWTGQGAPNN